MLPSVALEMPRRYGLIAFTAEVRGCSCGSTQQKTTTLRTAVDFSTPHTERREAGRDTTRTLYHAATTENTWCRRRSARPGRPTDPASARPCSACFRPGGGRALDQRRPSRLATATFRACQYENSYFLHVRTIDLDRSTRRTIRQRHRRVLDHSLIQYVRNRTADPCVHSTVPVLYMYM